MWVGMYVGGCRWGGSIVSGVSRILQGGKKNRIRGVERNKVCMSYQSKAA